MEKVSFSSPFTFRKGLSYLYSDMVLILISGFYYRPLSKKKVLMKAIKINEAYCFLTSLALSEVS